MGISVVFAYDENSGKWDPIVQGAESELEAKQAFNAVVLACQQLDASLLNKSKTEVINFDGDSYRIIPAMRG